MLTDIFVPPTPILFKVHAGIAPYAGISSYAGIAPDI
jgi:hypothetical protein